MRVLSHSRFRSRNTEFQPPIVLAGYYVSTTGSSGNPGTIASPWSLTHALGGAGGVIQPGDTIWIRAGTYTGAFLPTAVGGSANPVIFRAYPGERATINGTLRFTPASTAAYLYFRDIEIVNSAPAIGFAGVSIESRPGIKIINCIIHDQGSNGIFVNHSASGSEVYGCLIYNTGLAYPAIGETAHNLYIQNDDTVVRRIVSNITFQATGSDMHFYNESQTIRNTECDRNIGINAHAITGTLHWLLLMKSNEAGAVGNTFRFNVVHGSRSTGIIALGPNSSEAADLIVEDNYIYGGGFYINNCNDVTLKRNVIAVIENRWFIRPTSYYAEPPYDVDANTYWAPTGAANFLSWLNDVRQADRTFAQWVAATGYDSATSVQNTNGTGNPTTNFVQVNPNEYESGRAHIVIFNWELLSSVAVDVSAVLNSGDGYEVRNALDYYGTATLTGTYTSGTISVPMTAVAPPVPVTGWWSSTPPTPGPTFGAFVLRRISGSGAGVVTATHLTTAASATDATSYVTASISPSANKLILACVHSWSQSGNVTPTLTGNGLTWVAVNSAISIGGARVTVFRAMGASPSVGAVTIDCGGQIQYRQEWSIAEFGGVDTGGTNGSAAIVQSATNIGPATSLTMTLGAFGSTNNATYGAFGVHTDDADIVVGSGFTQLGEVTQFGETGAIMTEFRGDNDTTVDASWTTLSDVAGVAVEIKAA